MSPEPNLFPLGVATGSAHCNRKEERAELTRNVLTGAHTWLWGRRRMGKTSLVEQGLQDLARNRRKVVAATIDLLVVHDVQDLEVRIRTAVERLSASIVPKGPEIEREARRGVRGVETRILLRCDGPWRQAVAADSGDAGNRRDAARTRSGGGHVPTPGGDRARRVPAARPARIRDGEAWPGRRCPARGGEGSKRHVPVRGQPETSAGVDVRG